MFFGARNNGPTEFSNRSAATSRLFPEAGGVSRDWLGFVNCAMDVLAAIRFHPSRASICTGAAGCPRDRLNYQTMLRLPMHAACAPPTTFVAPTANGMTMLIYWTDIYEQSRHWVWTKLSSRGRLARSEVVG